MYVYIKVITVYIPEMPCSFSLSKPTAWYNTHTSLPKKLKTVVGVKLHCGIFFLQQYTLIYHMYTYTLDYAHHM